MTRILHIITKLELGGAQKHVLDVCRHIQRRGDDAFLAFGPGGELDGEADRLLGDRAFPIGSLVREIQPVRDLTALRELTNRIRKLKPSVVHTHSSKAGILGREAARRAGVPLIVHTVHGWGFHYGGPAWRNAVFAAFERRAARATRRLIAVSEATRRIGLQYGIGTESQYLVLPCGIDPALMPEPMDRERARRALGLPAEGKTVGAVVCLKPQKAPLDFVAVCAAIRGADPGVDFVLIGDGELRPEVERAAAKAGMEGRFHLAGWRPDAAACLAAMDVFVLTSRWEGLPLAVGEAMLAGVPVVATDVGGVGEAVLDGKTGFLRKPGDVAGLAEATLLLLRDAGLSRRLTAAARIHAMNLYDAAKMYEALEAIYQGRPGKT